MVAFAIDNPSILMTATNNDPAYLMQMSTGKEWLSQKDKTEIQLLFFTPLFGV